MHAGHELSAHAHNRSIDSASKNHDSNTCDNYVPIYCTVSLFNSKALVNTLMRLTGTCYLLQEM